jgi:hypothetical protein
MSSIVSFFYNFLCSLLDGTHGFGDRSYHTCACVASFLSLFFERALSYVRQLSIQRTNNNPRHTELPYGLCLRMRRGLMRLERQWGWLFSQPIVVHPCSPCHPVSRFREEYARRCSIAHEQMSSLSTASVWARVNVTIWWRLANRPQIHTSYLFCYWCYSCFPARGDSISCTLHTTCLATGDLGTGFPTCSTPHTITLITTYICLSLV